MKIIGDKNELGVVFTLEGIIDLFVTISKPEHAAHLVGWTDVTRKAIGYSRPLLEQADIDRLISACLIKMGEVAFSDAQYTRHSEYPESGATDCSAGIH